jgi:hypothetical protein
MMGFLLYDFKRVQVSHCSYVQLCEWPKALLQILCNIPSTDEAPFVHDDVNRKTNCYFWTQQIPHHIVQTNFQGLFDKRGAEN